MDLYRWLSDQSIVYERHEHPAVFTVADVKKLVPDLPAAKTKNLFFRDVKGRRHFLVVVEGDKRVDLKRLPQALDSARISFGSAKRLKRHLGVEPGAVSLLAVVNDRDHAVELFIDRDLWQADAFQFHPLVNTATLVVARDQIERFLAATGHEAKIVDIPGEPG
jgi:Ala-tRNA(Pro) deacylase